MSTRVSPYVGISPLAHVSPSSPPPAPPVDATPCALDAGWQELYDKTGRAYFYCPASGCMLDSLPEDLNVARVLWQAQDGSGPRVDLMAKAAWEDICKHARGAATRVSGPENETCA